MKVALTGGATGIGAALVEKLHAAGHHVTAFDIARPAGPVDQWVPLDLSDPGAIAKAADAVAGPFDALLNNAGLPPRAGLTETILQVNYFGLRAFLDAMLDKLAPGAAIVNTASRAGAFWQKNLDEVKALMALEDPERVADFVAARGIDHVRAYNLSKEAVIVMTLARTEEMIARGFRMNCVSPAAVSTGILDDFKAAFGAPVARNIERVGRPGTPDEVADVILYLTRAESHWLKGVDLTIDGGMSALGMTDMMGLPTG